MYIRLKELRKKRALSLTDLSQLSKVSRVTINLIENGKQNAQPRTIRALAQALKVDVEEFTSDQPRLM